MGVGRHRVVSGSLRAASDVPRRILPRRFAHACTCTVGRRLSSGGACRGRPRALWPMSLKCLVDA